MEAPLTSGRHEVAPPDWTVAGRRNGRRPNPAGGGVSAKVLDIAGSGRSGSTILDNILGQLDGFVSAGEGRFLWERGMKEDRACACGAAFSSCSSGQGAHDRVRRPSDGGPGTDDGSLAQGRGLGTSPGSSVWPVGESVRGGLDELPDRLSSLYGAIADAAGARVIVDSSKLPTYGMVLDQVPGVDLRIVHLVRDPRATAYLWRRKKSLPDKLGSTMQRQGPLKASALWMLWNGAAAAFWRKDRARYLRLRYEDFVRDPRSTIERVRAFAGEDPSGSPFVLETEVELTPSHSVAGNPSRFTTGRVALRPDDEWRTAMRPRDRAVVTAVTWPLLWRYGYVAGTRGDR